MQTTIRKRILTVSAGMLCLLMGASASATPNASDEGCVLTRAVASVREHVKGRYASALAEARLRMDMTSGVHLLEKCDAGGAPVWTHASRVESMPERIVLLIHGLDDPGTIWDDAGPAFAAAGHAVARFDYPNDQRIPDSTDLLAKWMSELRSRGVKHVDIVAHSMGGLIALDLLTRCEHYAGDLTGADVFPAVARLVTVGTPFTGSPLARFRTVMELRDQLVRWREAERFTLSHALGPFVDGDGGAGLDLLPDSDFLKDLNSRPVPADLPMTVIVGRALPVKPGDAASALDRWLLRRTIGEEGIALLSGIADSALELLGDGAVPDASAALAGAQATVLLDADHRSMLKTVPVMAFVRGVLGEKPGDPPAIAAVLEALASGQPAEPLE